jgi:hypothetical protein
MTLAMCPNVLSGRNYKRDNDAIVEAREKKRAAIDRVYPVEAYKDDGVDGEVSGDDAREIKEANGVFSRGIGECSVEELEWRIDHLSKSLDELRKIAKNLKDQSGQAPTPGV